MRDRDDVFFRDRDEARFDVVLDVLAFDAGDFFFFAAADPPRDVEADAFLRAMAAPGAGREERRARAG